MIGDYNSKAEQGNQKYKLKDLAGEKTRYTNDIPSKPETTY